MSDKKSSWLDDPDNRLNLHDWVDNNVELEPANETNNNQQQQNVFEQQIANGLTRVTMQGIPFSDSEDLTDSVEVNQAIGMFFLPNNLLLTSDIKLYFSRSYARPRSPDYRRTK